MNSHAFLNFLSLSLLQNRSKHLAIFLLSTLLIFLLSSTLFIVTALKSELYHSLDAESDFIIQKIHAGNATDTPLSWQDSLLDIKGVSAISSRLYGRYLLPDEGKYFMIVGVDFFDEQITQNLQKLCDRVDIKKFLERDQMIVGQGVADYLKRHYYEEYFHFITPTGEKKKVFYDSTFLESTSLLSNDTIIMPLSLAKEILGVEEEDATDIILNVANEAERENIAFKLKTLHFDARIIAKSDIKRAYDKYYNYKSGLFLLLFTLTLITFMLILYQRYAMVGSSDKKEISILRMMGWSIKDVLKLKLFESLFIGLFSFFLGVVLAYIFVFFLDAPLLREIFLGFGNLRFQPHFQPVIDGGMLSSIFLFFITPFLLSVIIPVWRIAIIDPYEGMK
jgi:ABC-type lipoprotein release transport system permease subunit